MRNGWSIEGFRYKLFIYTWTQETGSVWESQVLNVDVSNRPEAIKATAINAGSSIGAIEGNPEALGAVAAGAAEDGEPKEIPPDLGDPETWPDDPTWMGHLKISERVTFNYEMKTLADVKKQWTEGYLGSPGIRCLENKYGSKWRQYSRQVSLAAERGLEEKRKQLRKLSEKIRHIKNITELVEDFELEEVNMTRWRMSNPSVGTPYSWAELRRYLDKELRKRRPDFQERADKMRNVRRKSNPN